MTRSPMRRAVPLILTAVLAATACGDGDSSTAVPGFPLTVPSCERRVTFDRPAERVLTAASDAATAVAAVGAAGKIVARSAEGGAPLGEYAEELSRVPQLTLDDAPSQEAIIGQRPDVVVSYGLKTEVEPLRAAGIASLVPSWRCDTAADFEGIFTTLATYGRVLGTPEAADRAVTDLRGRVAAVRAGSAAVAPRTAANVYIGENRLSAYGGPSMSNTIMQTLGLTNVFADIDKRLADINGEALLARNPDVLILTFGGSETAIKDGDTALAALRGRPPLDQLAAVRTGHTFPINFTYLVGGPLAVDGLEMIARGLAP